MEKFRCLPAFLPVKIKSFYYLEPRSRSRFFLNIFIKQKPVSNQLVDQDLDLILNSAELELESKNHKQHCVTEISGSVQQRIINKNTHSKTYPTPTTIIKINQHLNLDLGLLTTVYLGLLKMASDAFIAFTSTTAETIRKEKVNNSNLAPNTNNEDLTKKYMVGL